MAVKLRMKRHGRKNRAFFRICAVDSRNPRDGRVIEELGTYDPWVADTDARCTLNSDRVKYWLSVGAQPSEKVHVLIKKYAEGGTHVSQAAAARARRKTKSPVPPAPSILRKATPQPAAAEGAEGEAAPAAE